MNWVSIGSDNGLSPVRCQAITWTNADLWPIGPLDTNLSEIRFKILTFSQNAFQNVIVEMSAILARAR